MGCGSYWNCLLRITTTQLCHLDKRIKVNRILLSFLKFDFHIGFIYAYRPLISTFKTTSYFFLVFLGGLFIHSSFLYRFLLFSPFVCGWFHLHSLYHYQPMTMFYQPYRRQQEPVSMTRLYNNIVIILCTGKKNNLGLCALVKPMKVNQGWQVVFLF